MIEQLRFDISPQSYLATGRERPVVRLHGITGLYELNASYVTVAEIPEQRTGKNWRYCTFILPPRFRVRVRATVKLSAAFFHDESSITIGGGELTKN